MKRRASAVLALGLLAGIVSSPLASAAPPNANLGQAVPESKFTGVSFGDAIDFVRDVSGANIHVDWTALAEASVNRDTPVNLRLRAVTLRKVLTVLLSEAGGGDALTFYVDENVIEVTTRAKADAKLVTRVYPIDDIIMDIPQFDSAPDFNLQNKSSSGKQGGSSGGGGGGGGMGLFNPSSAKSEPVKSKNDRAQELIDLIMATIRPDIWRENGGTASIRYFNGHIIVSAPVSVQEALGGAF